MRFTHLVLATLVAHAIAACTIVPGPLQTQSGSGPGSGGFAASSTSRPAVARTAPPVATEVAAGTALPATPAAQPTAAPAPTATARPTATTAPATPPTPTVAPIVPVTPTPLSIEQRWRAEQVNREVLGQRLIFTTSSYKELWWFDPINQSHLLLGFINGDFTVQARFSLRDQGVAALEVPYRINQDYGITALSPAILQRIEAVGYADQSVEAYVIVTPDIRQR